MQQDTSSLKATCLPPRTRGFHVPERLAGTLLGADIPGVSPLMICPSQCLLGASTFEMATGNGDGVWSIETNFLSSLPEPQFPPLCSGGNRRGCRWLCQGSSAPRSESLWGLLLLPWRAGRSMLAQGGAQGGSMVPPRLAGEDREPVTGDLAPRGKLPCGGAEGRGLRGAG